jgi:hypothetical protein
MANGRERTHITCRWKTPEADWRRRGAPRYPTDLPSGTFSFRSSYRNSLDIIGCRACKRSVPNSCTHTAQIETVAAPESPENGAARRSGRLRPPTFTRQAALTARKFCGKGLALICQRKGFTAQARYILIPSVNAVSDWTETEPKRHTHWAHLSIVSKVCQGTVGMWLASRQWRLQVSIESWPCPT